jgi:hypothetical protein
VQIFGGYGYTKDFPAEKFYRDSKLCTIGEGTSEIQKVVIAKNLLQGLMPLLRRLEQWTWPWAVSAVFLYVVLRAVHVPTFHDEAATFFHYVVTGEFLPSVALWDANNHLLNSALGGLAYRLFGPEPLFIRLPNVLAFSSMPFTCT